MNTESIRLTKTVKKGGCAAKVAATELRSILAKVNFPPANDRLVVDGRHFDDAAVYRVSHDLAIVQTIDFFTPILDSPFAFGQVAAANALSDVYAMGGKPVTALAVLAFPVAELPPEVVTEVLNGACEVMKRAGVSLAGGHSIDDDTLRFGLSVTGVVHPEKIWANTGARQGDDLILTKALGTGTLTAALKRDAVSETEISHAIESMTTLNDVIDHLGGLAAAVHGATDITGFGLSGHAMQFAKASHVQFQISMAAVPRLDRAEEFLQKEFLTKAHRSNRAYTEDSLRCEGLSSVEELLLHDPQTSGGLLLAVDPASTQAVLESLGPAFPFAARIGQVGAASDVRVLVG